MFLLQKYDAAACRAFTSHCLVACSLSACLQIASKRTLTQAIAQGTRHVHPQSIAQGTHPLGLVITLVLIWQCRLGRLRPPAHTPAVTPSAELEVNLSLLLLYLWG